LFDEVGPDEDVLHDAGPLGLELQAENMTVSGVMQDVRKKAIGVRSALEVSALACVVEHPGLVCN
jgi:hypothetical protein